MKHPNVFISQVRIVLSGVVQMEKNLSTGIVLVSSQTKSSVNIASPSKFNVPKTVINHAEMLNRIFY